MAVLPIASFLMLLFAGRGTFRPFLELYLRRRGLSGSEIGLVVGLGWALSVVSPLVWGVAADRSRRTRAMLAATCACATAVVVGLAIAPQLALLVGLAVAFKFLWAAGEPLIAALTLSEAERLGSDYGRLRLWASAGAGVAMLGAGLLVRHLGLTVVFYAYAGMSLLSLVPMRWIAEVGVSRPSLRLTQAWPLLRARSTQAVLLIAFLWSVSSPAYYSFYSIFLDDLGAGPVLISVAWAVSLVGDVAVLSRTGTIIRRYGVRALLVAGLLGSAIRWMAFALVPHPAWTLPFQLLHGLTFGATTTAAVVAIDRGCPADLRASGQGVLALVMNGLGGLVGSVLAGAAYQTIGARWLFGVSAVGAGATGLLAHLLLGTTALRRPCPPARGLKADNRRSEPLASADG